MPVRLGYASWPGATGCVSCSYTVSHGIAPGVAALEVPEQDVRKIAPYGDLVISDGEGTVVLRRCRVLDVSFRFSPTSGRTIVLSIADRRWRWAFGAVSGQWNQLDPYPDPDLFPPGEYVFSGGPYAPGTYRPAHLLMADLLVAMNEIKDPLIVPAPVIPVPVRWDAEPPAAALSSLAAQVGYRVVFQPNADRVQLSPAGVGKPLPTNLPTMAGTANFDLPGRPSGIVLQGGPTLYHDFLSLEPVGREKDGRFLPIDQLSYKPAGGWDTTQPPYFGDVVETPLLSKEEAIQLAQQHVWRTFRVKMVDVANPQSFGPVVAGYGRVYDRKQIVLNGVVYDGSRGINGQPNTEPAWCVGIVYMAGGPGRLKSQLDASGNTVFGDGRRLPFRPSVDTERGLVTFDRAMVQRAFGVTVPPDLYIYTSFSIRSIVGRVPVRFERGGALSGADPTCPPEVLHRPEIVEIVRGIRKDADLSLVTVGTNRDELIPAADYYLTAADQKYSVGAAADRTFAGIYPLDPDGAIQQVTWSVGGGQPATTRVSRNTEHAEYLPGFPERRKSEDLRRFVGKALKVEAGENIPQQLTPYKSQNPRPEGVT